MPGPGEASAAPEAAPPDLRRAAWRGLITASGIVVAALALVGVAAALTDRGPEAWALLRRVDGLRLALAWGVMTSGMVGLALRWRTFFPPGTRAPLVPLTAILFVGMLLNYALPGPVGEFVGAAMAARRFGMRAEAALAAGITARFLGLALAGLGALAAVETGAVPMPPDLGPWIRTATALLAVAAVGLVALGAWPVLLRRVADLTVGRIPPLRGLHASLVHFAEALGAVGRVGPAVYLRGAAWALAGHAAVVVGIGIAASSLGLAPAPAGLGFTYAASTAGAVALFAFPGGQLGWDTLFASLLHTTANLDIPGALALTLLVRLQQLTLVIFGCVLLLRGLRDGTAGTVG